MLLWDINICDFCYIVWPVVMFNIVQKLLQWDLNRDFCENFRVHQSWLQRYWVKRKFCIANQHWISRKKFRRLKMKFQSAKILTSRRNGPIVFYSILNVTRLNWWQRSICSISSRVFRSYAFVLRFIKDTIKSINTYSNAIHSTKSGSTYLKITQKCTQPDSAQLIKGSIKSQETQRKAEISLSTIFT